MDLNIIKQITPVLIKGSITTIELTAISVCLGSIIGIIVALLKLCNNKLVFYIGDFILGFLEELHYCYNYFLYIMDYPL